MVGLLSSYESLMIQHLCLLLKFCKREDFHLNFMIRFTVKKNFSHLTCFIFSSSITTPRDTAYFRNERRIAFENALTVSYLSLFSDLMENPSPQLDLIMVNK